MSNIIDILISAKDDASKKIQAVSGQIVELGNKTKTATKSLSDFSEKNKAGLASLAIASGAVFASMGL